MSIGVTHVDTSRLIEFRRFVGAGMKSVARKAGVSAVRAMRAEGSRQIRAMKNIKATQIEKALTILYPTNKDILAWGVKASGKPIPVIVFSPTQTTSAGRDEVTGQFTRARKVKGGRGGVYVTINLGKRVLIRGAFITRMKSGHLGVFLRRGRSRLPIREAYTTGAAGAFRRGMPAVLIRGRAVYLATAKRLIPLEMRRGTIAMVD